MWHLGRCLGGRGGFSGCSGGSRNFIILHNFENFSSSRHPELRSPQLEGTAEQGTGQ